ncbi:transglycosylase domain-containing protein [Nocardioides sp.]|uniref:transglycosylase domain-containing protein n=1 Tax=Nocardioides sp. TaxID=35761 RepID=UPI00260F6147|nr:transglycosylase domain-containing protein [Nocardioides sp.]
MKKTAASGKGATSGKGAGKAPRTWKQRGLSVLKWGTVVGLVMALLAGGAFFYLYQAVEIPDPNEDFETQTSLIYYADGETELGSFARQDRTIISYDEMPQEIKDAVVAAENETFWTDSGIDVRGIVRAALNNASGGSTQGASTITQQYVKVLYLSQEQSYSRKLKEALLALKLQRQISKTELLTNYLNTIYFGRGAYGIEAAAQAFFDKPAKRLKLREAAVLAAVLNNPTTFDPANGRDNKEALRGRYGYVLDQMLKLDMITAEEHEQAAKRLPTFPEIEAESAYGGQRGHMLTLVRNELLRLGYTEDQIDGGGLRVTTTLSEEAMTAAQEAVVEARPEGFGDKQLHVGTASVEVGTGRLLGFYAGQDYLDSQINWAVSGGMVGSTMKPVTLAAALKEGFSLNDTFAGTSPYVFPDGLEVTNPSGPYPARVNAVAAMEDSINTAFVDMSEALGGPSKIHKMALELGIPPTERDQRYPGIPATSRDLMPDDTLFTLGRARVSPINMANTYATIANGGRRAQVHVIERVELADGTVDYEFDEESERVLDEDIAADVSYAMQETVADGSGRTVLPLGRPAAGKTGTATNSDDDVSSAWFVGYTPQVATAVMYVRGDGDDQLDTWLPSYFGSGFPAQTWLALMTRMMEGVEVEDFPDPVFVDGDAPEGYEPTTAPPSPTRRPTPTRSPEPTESAEPTEEPTESAEPTQEPTDGPCEGLLCPSDSAEPSPSGEPTQSSSPSPSGNAGGGASSSAQPESRREDVP